MSGSLPPLINVHNNPNAIPARYVLGAFALLAGPPALFFVWFIRRMARKPARRNTATVLVLGDVGRSPRMMYHAESLAGKGWETGVVGYFGESGPARVGVLRGLAARGTCGGGEGGRAGR